MLAALAVSLGPLAAGLGKGYSSPAIASLQELQETRAELERRSRHHTPHTSPQSHVGHMRLNVTASSQ